MFFSNQDEPKKLLSRLSPNCRRKCELEKRWSRRKMCSTWNSHCGKQLLYF